MNYSLMKGHSKTTKLLSLVLSLMMVTSLFTVTGITASAYPTPTNCKVVWNKFNNAVALIFFENNTEPSATVDIPTAVDTIDTPDCTNKGYIYHVATIDVAGKRYTSINVETLDQLGHKWGDPEWTWNSDFSEATATFTCTNDSSHKETKKATVTSTESDVQIVYTAIVTFNGNEYQDEKTVTIEPPVDTTDSDTTDSETTDSETTDSETTDSETPVENKYVFVNGENVTWKSADGLLTLYIKRTDGKSAIDKLSGLTLNDNPLPTNYYQVTDIQDGIAVTFPPQVLSLLPNGTYTLGAVFADGSASTKVTIANEQAPVSLDSDSDTDSTTDSTTDSEPASDVDTDSKTTDSETTDSDKPVSSPDEPVTSPDQPANNDYVLVNSGNIIWKPGDGLLTLLVKRTDGKKAVENFVGLTVNGMPLPSNYYQVSELPDYMVITFAPQALALLPAGTYSVVIVFADGSVEEKITISAETPVESPDSPVESPDKPSESPDVPVESPDKPIESPDVPANNEYVLVNSGDITWKIGDGALTLMIKRTDGKSAFDKLVGLTVNGIPLPENYYQVTDTQDGIAITFAPQVLALLPSDVYTLVVNFTDGSVEKQVTIVGQSEPTIIGILGDVNDDNKVDSTDALVLLRASVELETLSDKQKLLGNVNLDGGVDSADALSVLRYSVDMVDNDKMGSPVTLPTA